MGGLYDSIYSRNTTNNLASSLDSIQMKQKVTVFATHYKIFLRRLQYLCFTPLYSTDSSQYHIIRSATSTRVTSDSAA